MILGPPRAQRGQAIVLIALMLTVIMGMAAIAIDGSRAYALRRDLQAAVDAAALAAGDKLQQSGSYTAAESAATGIFGTNLRLYSAPSCSPGYGSPGVSPYTVTCTFSDGTALTQVVSMLGPQGSRFSLTATRSLPLQFGRILTNGTNPMVGGVASGTVNNLAYTPAVGALNLAGCGGVAGQAVNVNGSGTLAVNGDVVSNGLINVTSSLSVAGDIYARCQSSVPGASNACYSSGAAAPCTFPDITGVTRSGFRLSNPGFPPPTVPGGSQGLPGSLVTLQPGIYAGLPFLTGLHCWFLSGGVYDFQAGLTNAGDFVSNELKPPDEPTVSFNNVRAVNQFWNTNGVNCAGSYDLEKTVGVVDVPTGNWSFVVTSVRTDSYGGNAFTRESAPSMCRSINVNNHFDEISLTVSNVPGATSYNIYAAPPPNMCTGPFGLAANLPVSGPVLNLNTTPCPLFTGAGCSLGHESITLASQLLPPFSPNPLAAPDTTGAYPPVSETAPLNAALPNQNPGRAPAARGDRANENSCESVPPAFAACPAAVTPGAVELYVPPGGCLTTNNGGDTYVFSGYQYNWLSVYEPSSNACVATLGAAGNSTYVGLVYAPGANILVTSRYAFESFGTGGMMGDTVTFTGGMPTITFGTAYAPVPPASRLTN